MAMIVVVKLVVNLTAGRRLAYYRHFCIIFGKCRCSQDYLFDPSYFA